MRLLALLLAASCATFSPSQYVDSGQYEAEVARVAADAQAFLAAHRPGKLAMVVDVDDTALSELPALRANDFRDVKDGPCDDLVHGPCGIFSYIAKGRMPPMRPVLDLVRYAKAHGVAVFFVTGRGEHLRAATERNLREAGYDFDAVICKPDHRPNSQFKPEARRRLMEEGWTIAVNIGDQESDLVGGYAERAFKVPNPFYTLR